MATYYECIHCGSVVQGFEAACSISTSCPGSPVGDHVWEETEGPLEEETRLSPKEHDAWPVLH